MPSAENQTTISLAEALATAARWRQQFPQGETITDALEVLAAEVDRLRAGLEKVAAPAKTAEELGAAPGAEYWCTVAQHRQDMAREALADER